MLLPLITATCVLQRTNTRFGDRAFRLAGSSVWNSLPADLRHPDLSLGHQFRRAIKRFCLTDSAAPSDCLLLGAAYKCTYLLTYLLISNGSRSRNEGRRRPSLKRVRLVGYKCAEAAYIISRDSNGSARQDGKRHKRVKDVASDKSPEPDKPIFCRCLSSPTPPPTNPSLLIPLVEPDGRHGHRVTAACSEAQLQITYNRSYHSLYRQ